MTPFQESASQVCRQEIPKMMAATDLQAALTVSAEMRQRLSVLTPPADQQAVFVQYLAALKGAEGAVISGDAGQGETANTYAVRNAKELGIDGACTTPRR
jgi:hypothetical protein